MMLSTALCASVGSLAVATSALWYNVRRPLNCCLAGGGIFLALWMGCWHGVFVGEDKAKWSGAAWIGAGFLPVLFALIRETLLNPGLPWLGRARSIPRWWLFSFAFGAWALRECIVHPDALTRHPLSGTDFTMAATVGVGSAVAFAISAVWLLRGRTGARRLELQLLILGACLTLLSAFLFPLIGVAANNVSWGRLMPLLVLALYGGTTWVLLTTRLLDAKHVLTIGLEKLLLVAGTSVFVWGIQQLAAEFMPDWLSIGVSIALGLWFVAEVRPWLQELTQRKAIAERVRRSAFEIARRELRPEQMEDAFIKLLTQWGNCERAVVLMASQGRLVGGGFEWFLNAPEMLLLHRMRWATPERLEREKPRTHGSALEKLMAAEGFGALVASGGPSLTFLIAMGVSRTRMPYTYVQIGQLIGLENTIETSLSRAHYLMKAQHAEQLATVGLLGASIAHEIRNPLVTIKTFVQLLPNRYQEEAFRDKFFRLIGDEVGRIDRMTEQLLDLSAPRVFTPQETAIHLLLSGCIDLIAAKADDKRVKITTDYQALNDLVYTDPNAVKQVVLNLGFNAIQALEQQAGDREVSISTRQEAGAVEVTIADNGAGISPEVWSRLFQPFQSTKSSGFGLGLAICRDILSNLQASITADAPVAGRGATFRILLPCQPPTS